MNKIFLLISITFLISTLTSCSSDDTADTADTTAPVIAEVTAVTTPNKDSTPDYTFSSDEAGTISYAGSCSSSTTAAVSGNNTITLVALVSGTYTDCTVTVKDSSGNVSNAITVTSFSVIEQMGGGFQGAELSLSTAVTTLAGTGSSGSTNGTGTAASFNQPQFITTDGTNLFTPDYSNYSIRKIVISTGVVTTLAGTGSSGSANGTGTAASFNGPAGIATDGTNLYVSEDANHLIRQIVISTGVVTTLAGTTSTTGSANGTGTAASFSSPQGMATDGTNLFVADMQNHLIRQIVISTGVVTTLAGTGSSGSANGTGTAASFNNPVGVETDGTYLYVADFSNELIRKIVISTGVVTTLAGTGSSGSTNGTGTAASFNGPAGISTDGTNLYVADFNNHMIRKIIISTGVVTTVAGSTTSGSANGTGTEASFNQPQGISTDGTKLYLSDRDNHLIRQID